MADEKRREPRVPTELNIKLAYGSVDEFIDRYALNISRGGIFVRTLEPESPGTPVTLNIEIGTGERIIRGRGVVTWTTPPSAPGEPERQPGMGVRFLQLDSESRALVDLVVATRGAGGRIDEPPRPEGEAVVEEEPEAVDLTEFLVAEPAPEEFPAAAPPAPEPPPARTAPAAAEPAPAPAAAGPAPAPGAAAPAAGPDGSPGARAPRRGKVVGIDLGTTNSCVAIAVDGKARVLASRQGYRTIPSVVAFDAQGRLLVGHPAKAQMIINPHNTVYGSKRLVGRPFQSPTVQACRDRFHYEIVEGPGGAAAVRFAGREFSLQQVAAFILKEMREMASQALGEEVSRAVVTVPAYYNDHQRNAVREAGELAGLHVERIVNEPTAAALAFGYGKGLDKRVLVYDLGGGTFDASVMEIQNDVYEVISSGGDTFLGGVDFDGQLMDHLVYRFMERHGFAPPEDRVAWQRIRDAAEETKVALSGREVAVAHVPYLCKDRQGRDVDLQVDVSRMDLEGLTERLVERSIAVAMEVLAAKGLGGGDVQEVLLVGGQSRMPLVWRKVRDAFGKDPNKGVHPDEAVALGAALLGASADRVDSVVLIDVLAMGIGVGLPGGRMVTLLPRNSRLPVKKAYEVGTTRDGQGEIELHVFQGDSPRAAECEYLGVVAVGGLPARPRGEVRVSVEFAVGAEGILGITARDLASGRVTEGRLATVDTPASLRHKLGLPEAPTAPKGARPIDTASQPAPPAGAPARKGLFGRLFGKK
ncbi:MAG TPA: TIGR02266 family protein [Anaeromyxobacteraceae bacterium]|nr:TIGR02266 family protein [Anaeromyxobacteraceae bacterium]